MKKTFTLTCLVLASIIGAGFASGKEIQVFFTKYGVISFVCIGISFFLFYYLIKLYLTYGNKFKPATFFDANKCIFGKHANIFNIFFLVCYLIVLAGMFAGVYEIYLNISNPIWAKVLVVITAFLCAIENSGGIKTMNIINNIFIPLTMLILLVSALLSFNNLVPQNNIITINNTVGAVGSLIVYLGMNLLLTSGVLMQVGKNYSTKTIKNSAILSAFVLVLIILIFNVALYFNNISTEMPMLTLAFNINYWWGLLVLICIWFCVYSAITSLTYVIVGYFSSSKQNNFTYNLIVVFIAYITSLFGFSEIVSYLYPIIGVVGTIYSIVIFFKVKQIKNKNLTTMQSGENMRIKGN